MHREQVLQVQDATVAVIAMERYRRTRGGWPPDMAALVPEFLPEVPPDRFTGQPLLYRLVDGKPLLYSAGCDRDDDGGRVPDEGANSAMQWIPPAEVEDAPDGDWVLWPRPRDKPS